MPQARSLSGLAALVTAMLGLQGCHGTSPTNPVTPQRTSAATSSASTSSSTPETLQFRRASFHLPSAIQREVGVAEGGTIYLVGGLNGADASVGTVDKVDPGRGLVEVVGQMPHPFHDGAG